MFPGLRPFYHLLWISIVIENEIKGNLATEKKLKPEWSSEKALKNFQEHWLHIMNNNKKPNWRKEVQFLANSCDFLEWHHWGTRLRKLGNPYRLLMSALAFHIR